MNEKDMYKIHIKDLMNRIDDVKFDLKKMTEFRSKLHKDKLALITIGKTTKTSLESKIKSL